MVRSMIDNPANTFFSQKLACRYLFQSFYLKFANFKNTVCGYIIFISGINVDNITVPPMPRLALTIQVLLKVKLHFHM